MKIPFMDILDELVFLIVTIIGIIIIMVILGTLLAILSPFTFPQLIKDFRATWRSIKYNKSCHPEW